MTQVIAQPGKFIKTTEGVIIYPVQTIPGNTPVVRLLIIPAGNS